jgi:hypothetical protein
MENSISMHSPLFGGTKPIMIMGILASLLRFGDVTMNLVDLPCLCQFSA